MASDERPQAIGRDPAMTQLLTDTLGAIKDGASRDDVIQRFLPEIVKAAKSNAGGVFRQLNGNWESEKCLGEVTPPEGLVSEASDRGGAVMDDGWYAIPLSTNPRNGVFSEQHSPTALVVRFDGPSNNGVATSLQQYASMMSVALHQIDTTGQLRCRISQLEAVMAAAADWQRCEDADTLLEKIANTATSLLNCNRASIFLWNKRRKKLIGKPALGIASGALEVDDNQGVVGEVLASGESKIWNGNSDDESRVNRTVDESTSFETKSLVAVPMYGSRNEIIGVFEAINHNDAGFEAYDATVLTDLATHAAVAIEGHRTRKKLAQSRDRLVDDAASASRMIGDHPALVALRQNAAKVAGTDLSVLIRGENGTGKEVLAKHVHYQSDRRSGPFVAVNCAALVESLLESELFGHEKGAFTDANQTRVGKFELASGGTLFLDEIGDMSLSGQAKLLRVLEEKVVVRVGGSQTIPVDVRVIAATNQPLEDLISSKRFREDLFFRLNVVPLTLPPLRLRGEDVVLLAEHFLGHFSYEIGRRKPELSEDAKQALVSHPWPGNIRELRNTIERVCYLTSSDTISPPDLMLSQSPGARLASPTISSSTSLADATREFQVAHIEGAIAACGGNMTDAAARLGLHRSNLYRKMRQLGMSSKEE